MIRKILLEGVRTHERTEIELGRLTCLVGPNGSGKSTILNAFVILGMKGFPTFWQRVGSDVCRIEVETSWGKLQHPAAEDSSGGGVSSVMKQIRVIPFRPDARVLRAPSTFADAQPKMGMTGSQLASVLAAWKLVDEQKFQAIVRHLQQIVPNLENIRPSTTTVDFDQPAFELLFDFRMAPGVPARAVSEGTLLALSILTAVQDFEDEATAENSGDMMVLLDDIDRGLHPDAQVELIKLLRSLAEEKTLQIVMTTHSPFVIDALVPEEVYVLKIDEKSGATRSGRLSEIPGAEKFRGMLSTGELWSSHGESWVLQKPRNSK
jgi:predicted ATPase